MKQYETAVIRPAPIRSIVYRMKREILESKIKKAKTKAERARLIKERDKLDRDMFGTIERG